MKTEIKMTNAGGRAPLLARAIAVFGFRVSGFFRHLSFVICHSDFFRTSVLGIQN
jgi:hypothetical protein